jgi:hypothetical protein
MTNWRNRRYRKWRWNMLVRSIMRPLHIHPWWDPEYDAHIARERAEVAELLASLDENSAALAGEKP